jgi:hypothetical protein
MNNSSDLQNQTDNQQQIAAISAQANGYITQIQGLKSQVMSNISDVEVTYNPQARQDISAAVLQVFGTETPSATDPTENAITLDMVIYCMDLINASGKYQATQVLSSQL